MTQPIDRETAIALAKEAGMAGMLTDVVCSLEEIHRLCNLAVAHSRKDAEPVEYQYRSKPSWEKNWLPWERCTKDCYLDYAKAPLLHDWQYEARALYIHPPEADKLLQQALEALEYRLQQTRPIHQADVVMEAIRTYLEGKK